MAEDKHNALLRQAVDAIKAGDREGARGYLEEILQTDDENVRAWLLLARITENEDERRLCLTTVLQLDPGNERARKMLDEMDASMDAPKTDEEVIPGVTRRQLLLFGGGTAAVVVLVLMVVGAIVISNNASASRDNRRATEAQETIVALRALETQAVLDGTSTAEAAEATRFAITSPTPSPTPTRPANAPTLQPTWTPVPEQGAAAVTALPQPENVTGTLVGWSGRDTLNIGFLPVVFYPLENGVPVPVPIDTLGRDSHSADGQLVVYARYFRQTRDIGFEAVGAGGENPRMLNELWSGRVEIAEVEDPHLSEDGTLLVFTALAPPEFNRQVFLLNLTTAYEQATAVAINPPTEGEGPALPLVQLTADPNSDYHSPALSADNGRIVAIRERTQGNLIGADVVIIDVNSRTQTLVTSDGNAITETNPSWAPDGSTVAFAAQPQGSRVSDIVVSSLDGTITFSPGSSEADDIGPVYSPDGLALAFSSDRAGAYNIFIYNFRSQTLAQLTNSPEDDFVSDWFIPGFGGG